MYIKIGTEAKPLGLKVAGGFIVDTPILKISSYQTQLSVYSDTPSTAFTKAPINIYPEKPTVSVSVSYFRSYLDYLNSESSIVFNTIEPLLIPNDLVLQSNYYGLEINGEVTLQNIYEVLKNKIGETFKNISLVNE